MYQRSCLWQLCNCTKVRGIPLTLPPNDVGAIEIEMDFGKVGETLARQADAPDFSVKSPLEVPIYLDVVSAPVSIKVCARSE